MIPITLLKWNWVTLWIGLSKFSTHYSHIMDGSLVLCMLLKIKQQKKNMRMRVWLGISTYKKSYISYSFHQRLYKSYIHYLHPLCTN